jgi:hypothetical protein
LKRPWHKQCSKTLGPLSGSGAATNFLGIGARDIRSLSEKWQLISRRYSPRANNRVAKAQLVQEALEATKAESGLALCYLERLPWFYARVFLYALDQIGKTLRVLADDTRVAGVGEASKRFEARLAGVTPVRNTLQDMEDHGRLLDHKKQPLACGPSTLRPFKLQEEVSRSWRAWMAISIARPAPMVPYAQLR